MLHKSKYNIREKERKKERRKERERERERERKKERKKEVEVCSVSCIGPLMDIGKQFLEFVDR